MRVTSWRKLALISISVLFLAACSSAHKNTDNAAIEEANAAYQSDNEAETAGLGEESGFGSEESQGNLQAKRTYYFDFDSNVVHQEDKAAIAANARYLSAHTSTKIIVEGHTDPRGSREYNIGLGERRASAVADLLRSGGVRPEQIRIVSYGAEKAGAGHSEADYQRDRRVVILYLRQ